MRWDRGRAGKGSEGPSEKRLVSHRGPSCTQTRKCARTQTHAYARTHARTHARTCTQEGGHQAKRGAPWPRAAPIRACACGPVRVGAGALGGWFVSAAEPRLGAVNAAEAGREARREGQRGERAGCTDRRCNRRRGVKQPGLGGDVRSRSLARLAPAQPASRLLPRHCPKPSAPSVQTSPSLTPSASHRKVPWPLQVAPVWYFSPIPAWHDKCIRPSQVRQVNKPV
jgi:hypothetical protein